MPRTIRPTLSEKNRYWIDRHRYYELKHFCLQYRSWKKGYNEVSTLSTRQIESACSKAVKCSDPTERVAMIRTYFLDRMEMVEKAAREASPDLATYILTAVTEERSYDYLKTVMNIPCCRDVYYDLYRRFFWILSNLRN